MTFRETFCSQKHVNFDILLSTQLSFTIMTTTIVDENQLFTARKRSLGRGYMFTDVCLSTRGVAWSRGGVWSQGGAWWRSPRMATASGGMHAT